MDNILWTCHETWPLIQFGLFFSSNPRELRSQGRCGRYSDEWPKFQGTEWESMKSNNNNNKQTQWAYFQAWFLPPPSRSTPCPCRCRGRCRRWWRRFGPTRTWRAQSSSPPSLAASSLEPTSSKDSCSSPHTPHWLYSFFTAKLWALWSTVWRNEYCSFSLNSWSLFGSKLWGTTNMLGAVRVRWRLAQGHLDTWLGAGARGSNQQPSGLPDNRS